MRQNITFRQALLIVVFIAVVQFTIQMSLLTRGVEYTASSLAIDDTYYYLQTAWNTKELGFVTFDGIHTTNGVQFLWFGIILFLAMLAQTKTTLLIGTMAVSFLLNALCYIPILKIGTAVKRPLLAVFLASMWSLQSLPFRIYSMGMENSLHALVYWCVIWQGVIFLMRVKSGARPNFLGLTIVLTLNVWTRLDAALLSVVLFAFCIVTLAYSYRDDLKLFLQQYWKSIVLSVLLAGVGLIIQLTSFKLMGDSFLPVSALVKTSGAIRGLGVESLHKFVEVLILGMPLILQGRLSDLLLILLGIIAILFVLRASTILPTHGLKPLVSLWSCLLVGELLYHVYIAISGVDYIPYFAWYRSPSFIFWIITLSLVAIFLFEYIKLIRLPFYLRKWAPVGFTLLIFSVSLYMFARSINFTSQLYSTRYTTALWITQNLQPDNVFASWNAGQLSYFSDRTFINLDGVINSVDYFEQVLRGSTSLTDYLHQNGVDYLVDYATYSPLPDFPVVQAFPINDGSGRSIQIWKVSTQNSFAP